MKENRKPVFPPVWLIRCSIALLPALASLVAALQSLAQLPPDMPLQFKMVGEFHDPEQDPNRGGVNAFTVNIEKTTWIFDIESSHTLEGSALGSSVLKNIYPPIMTFVGPKELTEQLTNPEIAGKSYSLKGQLYVKKRMFRLTDVQGPGEKAEARPGGESNSDNKAALPASR